MYTGSRIGIDSLKEPSNYNYFVEEIKNKLINLRSAKWTIEITWIKAHAGNIGNKLADHLPTDAASETDIPVVFGRIPKTTLLSELEKIPHLNGKKNGKSIIRLPELNRSSQKYGAVFNTQ